MVDVDESLAAVRELIKLNMHDAQNPDGVLTGDVETYLECLKIEHEKLELLFRSNET